MEDDTPSDITPDSLERAPQIAFDYIKSALFRVVHVDGAIGGMTPNGGVHLAFFSERPPIPKREVRPINPDGSLGDVDPKQSLRRSAIIREVDFDIIMSLHVAEELAAWLQTAVSDAKHRMGLSANSQKLGDG